MNIRLPRDFTPEEMELFQYLTKGLDCFDTSSIYSLIDNDTDRFIVCYVFEVGYTRKSLEPILNMTKSQLHTRIKNIKANLYRKYKLSNQAKKIDKIEL